VVPDLLLLNLKGNIHVQDLVRGLTTSLASEAHATGLGPDHLDVTNLGTLDRGPTPVPGLAHIPVTEDEGLTPGVQCLTEGDTMEAEITLSLVDALECSA